MQEEKDLGLPKEELRQLRKEGGRWLKDMREKAGISQKALADKLGAEYYSFVSQLESGKGQIPPGKVELWADAVGADHREFALNFLRYYNPLLYRMLTAGKTESLDLDNLLAPIPPTLRGSPTEAAPVGDLEEIKARLSRLEAVLMVGTVTKLRK